MKTVSSDSKSMRTIFLDAEGCTVIVFGTKETHECCLLPIDTSGASLCTSWQNVQGRKGSSCNISLYCILHGEDSFDWVETSSTSTLQSRCNPLRFPFVWINKTSNVRQAIGCWESCFCFWTAGTELCDSGIFKSRQKCVSCYGDFVEKWIQFVDLTYLVWSAWSWN